jgi:hypothetical protein
VDEFIDGKEDPALKHIPPEELTRFYNQLQNELNAG